MAIPLLSTWEVVSLYLGTDATPAQRRELRQRIYNAERAGSIIRYGKPGRGNARWNPLEIKPLTKGMDIPET